MKTVTKKIVLLGNEGVGKTSLVKRFVHSIFSDEYLTTIGIKISKKSVQLADVEVNLMLWDIAGNMLSKTLYNNYLKGAHGVFLVCDAVRPETYDSIIQELEGDLQKIKDKTKMFVIINKADLLTDENRSAILAEKSYDFLTSAKVGENVEEAFRQMAAEIVNQ